MSITGLAVAMGALILYHTLSFLWRLGHLDTGYNPYSYAIMLASTHMVVISIIAYVGLGILALGAAALLIGGIVYATTYYNKETKACRNRLTELNTQLIDAKSDHETFLLNIKEVNARENNVVTELGKTAFNHPNDVVHYESPLKTLQTLPWSPENYREYRRPSGYQQDFSAY